MARTTLNIDSSILRDIRSLQKTTGRSMGEIVSHLLAEALARRKRESSHAAFEWTSRPMGARVDIEDKDALYAALDLESS